MDKRKSIKGFLQGCLTGEPTGADIEDAGLGGPLLAATRKWTGLIRRTHEPGPGLRGDASALIEQGADALTEALTDDFAPTAEDPEALAADVWR